MPNQDQGTLNLEPETKNLARLPPPSTRLNLIWTEDLITLHRGNPETTFDKASAIAKITEDL